MAKKSADKLPEKLEWLKIYNSPFIPPHIKFYFGRIRVGVPYFFPRVWKKQPDQKLKPFPKKIGFDFVGLGYKTKWSATDYRHEYSPLISFVFLKWQFAIYFDLPLPDITWEIWLYYNYNTDRTLSKFERLDKCIEFDSLTYKIHSQNNGEEIINYYKNILKSKYHKQVQDLKPK